MITKRGLIIVLATFCLTALIFQVLPAGTQTPGQYNPWADINDDGRINILDAINLGSSFGTTGDPTKNVSVTNWPTIIQTMAATNSGRIVWVNPLPGVSDGWHDFAAIETKGYKKLYFSLTGRCNLTIGWCIQGFNYSSSWREQIDQYEEFETAVYGNAWREFDIKGETIVIILGDTFANSYRMSYYMTA